MRRTGLLLIAAAAVLVTGFQIAPARADADDWQVWRGHEWREHEWREHARHEWWEHHRQPAYYSYGYYYAPPVYYYAVPQVTYGYAYP